METKLNVLSINYAARRGGAAIAARRLHETLADSGHTSRMLVAQGGGSTGAVRNLPALGIAGRIPFHALNIVGLNYAGIPGSGKLVRHPFFAAADVVHLHNLHGGFFNYLALPVLAAAKPLIWTLHDMWPLTGHCAHSLECDRWRNGCGRCPHPETYPAIRMDSTRTEWRLKRRAYDRSRMTITCPSAWLTGIAGESILGQHPIRHIPNGVNTDVLKPLDRAHARDHLGWPRDKFAMVFVAESARNPLKNFPLLQRTLERLPSSLRDRMLLAVMGADPPTQEQCGGAELRALGYVPGDSAKAFVFSAADALVHCTRADNQPLVILEAMACGCPVLSVRVGGVPELVTHEETGYLAEPDDTEHLRAGMQFLVDNPARRIALGEACRRFVVAKHNLRSHVDGMLDVYRQAIANRRTGRE